MKAYIKPEIDINKLNVSDVINNEYNSNPDGEDVSWDNNWTSLLGN